jgi:hypothetical protein
MKAQYGALGGLFTAARAVQMICLIAIIGMASNFIAEIVAVQQAPHQVLIGTLTVVSSYNSPKTPQNPPHT